MESKIVRHQRGMLLHLCQLFADGSKIIRLFFSIPSLNYYIFIQIQV